MRHTKLTRKEQWALMEGARIGACKVRDLTPGHKNWKPYVDAAVSCAQRLLECGDIDFRWERTEGDNPTTKEDKDADRS